MLEGNQDIMSLREEFGALVPWKISNLGKHMFVSIQQNLNSFSPMFFA